MTTPLEGSVEGGSASVLAEPPDCSIVLRARSVVKSFGATRALRDCSIEVGRGEVHAILGENGSGKSTLVKVFAGVQRPDSGMIDLGGETIPGFRSPAAASAAGIVAVFQEVLVAAPRSILDNVWLGTDHLIRHGVPRAERERRAREVLGELLGREPDVHQAVEELPLSDRQACCLARALVRDFQVLILDEATSALDIATRDRLFAILRRLRSEGKGIVFISHRMDEIDEISDRVTVMRQGSVVGCRQRGEVDAAALVRMMTGEQEAKARHRLAEHRRAATEVVLKMTGVELVEGSSPIDFSLHAGELVGLAGLEGHGQDLFLKAAWGGSKQAGKLERTLPAGAGEIRSPSDAFRHGIAYVPRERHREGLLTGMSVRANFVLPTVGHDTQWGRVRDRRTQRRFQHYVDLLGIRLGAADDPIETLSGGNQQKVVMARWLAADPRILLLNDPTRGVDVGAKRDLYDLLERLTTDGVAIMMLSTEVDEHVELMDRVLVFRSGQLADELVRPDITRARLVSSFFGTKDARADRTSSRA